MKVILAFVIAISLTTAATAAPNPSSSKGAKPKTAHSKGTSSKKSELKVSKLKVPAFATEAAKKPGKTSKPSLEEEALAKLTPDERLQLQVFLDRASFAPGKVDGLVGEFTLKAAQRWIRVAPDRSFHALLDAAHGMSFEPTTIFFIPETAAKFVGEVPTSLADKATAKRLPYSSLAEFVAERFHTDEAALARLNPRMNIEKISIGDSLRVPNVIPFKIESPKLDSNASRLSGAQLHILHEQHMLEVHHASGALVAAFPITVGSKPEHVRTGTWKVMSMTPNPTFTWDDEMLKNGRKGDTQFVLPPGPNNPVGVLWMELEPVSGPEAHIGIHGTNDPTHIGRNHSSGCIRLANWDVVRLARIIGPGTSVIWKNTIALLALAKGE